MSFDGGHDSHPPLIGCGGGGGFIHQLCEKPHPPPSSEELDNNQKKYGGHHRFDPLGKQASKQARSGGGTRRSRRTSITDSSSNGESFSVTNPNPNPNPTDTDLLSQLILSIAFKPITRKAPVSVVEAMLFDYLPKSSICSPPPDLMHVEANNSQGDDYDFPGFESEDDKFYYEVDSDDDDDDSGDDESVYYSNDDDDDEYYHPSSQIRYALVEVLSVIINKNKYMEKNPSLYGTIRLNDGIKGPVYIYNTKREDSESISLSGGRKARLSLTGHSRAVAAIDNFSMEVDLMDNNKGSKLSPDDDDDVFCRGCIHWQLHIPLVRKYEDGEVSSVHQFLPYKYIYDKPLAADFVGRSGSVKVNYIMWWEGVRATVEVTLLNRKGADVYGLIRAGNSHIRGISYYCSVLFEKKKSDESIDVPPGQLIPLSRSVVAVNYSSSLTVLVDLYDRHRKRDLSQDYEIAKGTANFPAQEFGTVEKNIPGRHGAFQDWVLGGTLFK